MSAASVQPRDGVKSFHGVAIFSNQNGGMIIVLARMPKGLWLILGPRKSERRADHILILPC